MRLSKRVAFAAAVLLLGATACADLNVTNPNDPDRAKALASAGDVESLLSGSYNTWFNGNFYTNTFTLRQASFEAIGTQANFGNLDVSGIPRLPYQNVASYVDLGTVIGRAWTRSYRALSATSDGLKSLNDNPDLGTELGASNEARIRTFAKFVQAMSHATLALEYDQAYIVDENFDAAAENTSVPWPDVWTAAVGEFDEAIAGCSGASWSIPKAWLGVDADVTAANLCRLAHSYRALFRASMPRTPADAIDWNAVTADLDAGLTADFMMDANYNTGNFYDGAWDYGNGPNGWGADTYFMIGMADQAGQYQEWLAAPVADRTADLSGGPFLIQTPDTRFPTGHTIQEQIANPGEYYVIPQDDPEGYSYEEHFTLPGRGTWRWSYYANSTGFGYWNGTQFKHPLVSFAELDLLRAEAMLVGGNTAGAAAIIDKTRTKHGLDASGDGNGACVPKLPNGSCGNLMEMLKWEVRMETRTNGGLFRSSWYYDGRRWGDLYNGTPLQLPIPITDLQTLSLPGYTFGGVGGESAAAVSSYHFPFEG